MKHFRLFIVLLSTLSTGACKQHSTDNNMMESSNDSTSLVLQISKQSRLYTAEYQVHKIVTHDDLLQVKGKILGRSYNHQINLGDRKIAIPIDVTLRAYVDFSTFSAQNVEHSGNYIHITLPDPVIIVTSSRMDHNGIQQFTSLFRSKYSDSEITEFTKQGVESVVQSIPQMGLMETARQNAALTLIPMLEEMGYAQDHVIISFRDEISTISPTLSQHEGETMILKFDR